jgi:hypothetical protein
MTTDPPFTPPRKKLNILWLVAGLLLLLIGLFFLQLFGPNPPIVVSPQTTFVTNPIGPDGLPDYERYVLENDRKGVSPSNNAATLLWQALWPGELSPQQYGPMAAELGLAQIPSASEALGSPHKDVCPKLEVWLQTRPEAKTLGNLEEAADSVMSRSMARPWTSEQIPPAAEWIAKNQKPLDLVVTASRRPKFHSPSPSVLDNKRDLLVSMLLPGVGRIREAARSLSIRAMWNLGEGRPMEAWSDVLAIYRLSRLLGQSRTLIEQLVGMALDEMANSATQSLLESRELTAAQIAQIRRDLDGVPPISGVAIALDQSERLMAIDAFVCIAAGGQREMLAEMGLQDGAVAGGVLEAVSVDWNLVLREANGWYDRLVSAARMKDRDARNAAIQKINGDVDRLVTESRAASSIAAAVVSRQQRSEMVSAMMLGLFLPAVSLAIDREDEQNVAMELTRMAAALAQFRAGNGVYPEILDELVPGVVKTMPNDPYSGKPYVYARDGEGFLFYSVGANGIDDGGSSERKQIQSGRPLDDLDEAARSQAMIPAGADDPSVRAPRPQFELPKAATTGEP